MLTDRLKRKEGLNIGLIKLNYIWFIDDTLILAINAKALQTIIKFGGKFEEVCDENIWGEVKLWVLMTQRSHNYGKGRENTMG